MHFCFIIENGWQIGGGSYAQFKYAEHLALRGHRVTVFAQFHKEFMDKLQRSPLLRMHFYGGLPPVVRGAGRLNALWWEAYSKLRIEPFLKAKDSLPDVLVGFSRRSAILADRLGRKFGIPCAHVVFETPDWMSRDLGKVHDDVYHGALKREWEETREVYRRAKWLLPNSELTRREVERWTGRPVEPAIYAGLDDPGPVKGDPAEGRHILYIGRLDVTKNVHDLIDAVALLDNPPPLVIAGRGHDEDELKARALEKSVNAIFPGHVSDAEKWELIRSCYMLVFPTSFEGFGMPPGEALSCSKPVLCSDLPILREVYGDVVEYFPLREISAMASKLHEILKDGQYRRVRGENGRSYVLNRYTWSICSQRIENIIMNRIE